MSCLLVSVELKFNVLEIACYFRFLDPKQARGLGWSVTVMKVMIKKVMAVMKKAPNLSQ